MLSFFNWLDDENIPLPSRAATLDDLLARYLEHLWLDDIHITYAGHTLSALRRFYPRLRFKTPTARQFFTNWKSVHVPRQAVPMPAEVAMALAGVAISVKDEPLALLILLGFTAFLRTGEIIRLQRNHIQVDCRSGQIILALPATKTSRNKQESVAVVDPKIAHLARRVLQAGAGTFVCHMSANFSGRSFKPCSISSNLAGIASLGTAYAAEGRLTPSRVEHILISYWSLVAGKTSRLPDNTLTRGVRRWCKFN